MLFLGILHISEKYIAFKLLDDIIRQFCTNCSLPSSNKNWGPAQQFFNYGRPQALRARGAV